MHRSILVAGMLLAGAGALGFLGVSCVRADTAKSDIPTINVIAKLPGTSAETIAGSIAMPLEQEFSKIAAVKSLASSSRRGETSITVQFEPGRAIDPAARDVQAAIDDGRPGLPLHTQMSRT